MFFLRRSHNYEVYLFDKKEKEYSTFFFTFSVMSPLQNAKDNTITF